MDKIYLKRITGIPDAGENQFAVWNLMAWRTSNAKDTYLPHLNTEYKPEEEARDIPFVNLYEACMKGAEIPEIIIQN